MGFTGFTIELDGKPIYEAGEIIKGEIVIFCEENGDELASLTVNAVGRVGTHNKLEGNLSTIPIEEILFLEQEDIFEEKVDILPPVANKVYHLNSGENRYSFSITIPMRELPSSLMGRHGRVYYKVIALAKRPNSENIEKSEKHIFFRGIVDLNSDPALSEPPRPLIKDKLLTSCWCGQGSIGYTVTLNKTGFTPGDEIICSVDAYNLAKDKKKGKRKLSVTLSSVGTYILQGKSIYDGKDHTKYDGPTLSPGETLSDPIKMVIPIPTEIPPSGMKRSKLIDIEYRIQINMLNAISGAIEIPGHIPIVIGTSKISTWVV